MRPIVRRAGRLAPLELARAVIEHAILGKGGGVGIRIEDGNLPRFSS
jgi:hypothetical protein